MIAKTFVFSTLISLSFAATWSAYASAKPAEFADKEGCYVEEMNDVIPYGSKATPIGHCFRVECDGGMLYYASCGLTIAAPGCHVAEEDLTKPYPDCCSKVKCEEDNSV